VERRAPYSWLDEKSAITCAEAAKASAAGGAVAGKMQLSGAVTVQTRYCGIARAWLCSSVSFNEAASYDAESAPETPRMSTSSKHVESLLLCQI
jgi:hypothetical protein